MDVEQLLDRVLQHTSAGHVYGEPYERNGVVVIPAAAVVGGGGGGNEGETKQGGGFGIVAKPAGAWVIDGHRVRWVPAVDVTRIILGGQLLALAGLLLAQSIVQRRSPRVAGRRSGRLGLETRVRRPARRV